ncbi:23S rRNA (cytidine1920-2'-O)/16S rRNA (cytidine1409-2'-O)-methyltransferase [Allopseudospirillum japonicum]|uniref:23S rRNA (Cytidine1920-2'-O)/16S rRNA (Cytidine1409-2'-O)-methyltransferase n=1 Tax=Allopseudospirillum japonicum TaxID=64971 RepID=A0A1H6RW39_9GAMM|nr:TlyA family RNA methyltransferase [Allopseudospirillum japonicum]SEI60078.1 23S rRNA (cytidine1920-2'-O)/16S rRNA (cytidine1409-2'-O)-methyltransferase [Allopseudospirillum japonicum]
MTMQRLDRLLVEQGLAESRTQAQNWIAQGRVFVAGQAQALTKNSLKLALETPLHLQTDPTQEQYVSRAGHKLAALLEAQALSLTGHYVLDIGQSTGGFTDCALQAGAAFVVGVEVGHSQLAKKLQGHAQLTTFEGMNARYLSQDARKILGCIPVDAFDDVVMDVSFISQSLIFPELHSVTRSGSRLLSLIKPQFEVGKAALGKKGIVKDRVAAQNACQRLILHLQHLGWQVLHFMPSPIQGGDGNQEFLIYAQRQ